MGIRGVSGEVTGPFGPHRAIERVYEQINALAQAEQIHPGQINDLLQAIERMDRAELTTDERKRLDALKNALQGTPVVHLESSYDAVVQQAQTLCENPNAITPAQVDAMVQQIEQTPVSLPSQKATLDAIKEQLQSLDLSRIQYLQSRLAIIRALPPQPPDSPLNVPGMMADGQQQLAAQLAPLSVIADVIEREQDFETVRSDAITLASASPRDVTQDQVDSLLMRMNQLSADPQLPSLLQNDLNAITAQVEMLRLKPSIANLQDEIAQLQQRMQSGDGALKWQCDALINELNVVQAQVTGAQNTILNVMENA